jgi:hypothetical protein
VKPTSCLQISKKKTICTNIILQKDDCLHNKNLLSSTNGSKTNLRENKNTNTGHKNQSPLSLAQAHPQHEYLKLKKGKEMLGHHSSLLLPLL